MNKIVTLLQNTQAKLTSGLTTFTVKIKTDKEFQKTAACIVAGLIVVVILVRCA